MLSDEETAKSSATSSSVACLHCECHQHKHIKELALFMALLVALKLKDTQLA
jgi:hypothetical protein